MPVTVSIDSKARVRASDAERDAVAERLRIACGEGRLTPDELSARLDRCLRAKTLGELRPLTADLPAPGRGMEPRRRRAVARRGRPNAALIILGVVAICMFAPLIAVLAMSAVIGTGIVAVIAAVKLAPYLLVVIGMAWLVRRLYAPSAHRLR